MAVTIDDINKLREITGIGIMDCKKALEKTDGDIDKAISILREDGCKISQKRSGNETKEGCVMAHVNEKKDFGVIATVKSETDFVSNSQVVVSFLDEVCKKASENKVKDIHSLVLSNNMTVDENVNDIISRVKEKICFDYTYLDCHNIVAYTHFNKTIAILLSFIGEKNDVNINICEDVCLNIAATNPLALKCSDIKKEIIDEEIRLATSNATEKTNNEDIIKKIVDGKMQSFYKDSVLLEQNSIKDGTTPIKNILEKNNITIVDYKRVSVK